MRAIDADELKKKAFGKRGGLIHTADIDAMPTIEERKTGKWITNSTIINCSVCKHCSWSKNAFEDLVRSFHYCPNCGARMQGKEGGEYV